MPFPDHRNADNEKQDGHDRGVVVNQPFPQPVQGPGRHNWADLLRLVDDLRRLAYDRTLDDGDRARMIRDRFGEDDGRFDDDR
jgi:hypothetical protein